ncbi:C25 family cysteine peptidase [Pseudobacter ginsenosidimutans]|uniref:Peptidase C25-like protein n=1 Tax=Pseudobacter ginsenosidimutans TaxID=661488 RepID=A0A4V2F091_9BACT|nr:C25 family cysteine peptidase [Pseudobacter ginsenosidimutans]QEC40230.1 hypothetical protein FSB84_00425 [Pseudobacter ginsenosidimutans]RZS69170.1 peptidase C25-like protein [Pseudobacter ginsenosidimutans]
MRKFFTLLLVLVGFNLAAQPYNNEWIKYGQPYYKFRIGKTGLFRIPQAVLAAAGMENVPVENLEIWRNGVQVPFTPSAAGGALPPGGYIDFYGEKMDGKQDKAFYRNPVYQHTDKVSLLGDSATYFITAGAGPNPNRVVQGTNNAPSSSLTPEPYLMYKSGTYYTQKWNPGYASVLPEYVYLSSYDQGEFRSSLDISPSTARAINIGPLFPYIGGGPQATFSYGAAGNAQNARSVRALVNGSVVDEAVMDYFNDTKRTVNISTSLLTPATFAVRWENGSQVSTDRYVVSYFEIDYPRLFNFNNQAFFEFIWPAKGSPSLLEISNFKSGGQTPVLIDITNKIRYTAHIQDGKFRFEVPASATDIRYVMATVNQADYSLISSLQRRDFVNYTTAVPDANYLIISNSILFSGSNGNNPVEDYKQYRESAAGGGFKAVVAEIEQLVDQFGFGARKNPQAVRNYIEYARTHLNAPQKYVFIVGRGMIYSDYVQNSAAATSDRLNLVPTWGHPGSDNLMSAGFSNNPVANTPIGRLSVVHPAEVEDYLNKVKEHEAIQKNAPQTLEGREWMKNVVHVTGSSEPYLGSVLCNYMGAYKSIIADTLFGGKVSTFCKVSTNSVEQLTSDHLVRLFNEGISLLTYFGHSSSTTLEFNIDNPYNYNNQGKYPLFCVNGCNAGNFFTNTPARLLTNETLSEKFVLAKNRGAIGFIASTHLGVVSYLNLFLTNFYAEVCHKDYGKSIGEINRDALRDLFNNSGDYYSRMHAEQITLHGDPAVFLNGSERPDYVMEESGIRITPTFISVAESTFKLKVRMVNIGKAIKDSIMVEVKRQLPDNTYQTIYREKRRGIMWADSLAFDVPIVATRDKGRNRIYVTIDSENTTIETDESNNSAYKEFFIYDEEARPAYPFNLGIVHEPNTKFYASTANPFSQLRQYVMELDTTQLFNSSIKITRTISASGGVLEFDPAASFLDSTVYYWRVATVPPPGDNNYQWNNASFTYMAGTSTGFGQDHYFQHQQSTPVGLVLDTDRKWKFAETQNLIDVYSGVYPHAGGQDRDYAVFINDNPTMTSACVGSSIIFNVIDPKTMKPWKNVDDNGNNRNFMGSGNANSTCGPGRLYNFEYSYSNKTSRNNMVKFLDYVPDGFWIVARSVDATLPGLLPKNWKTDSTIGNTLYDRLLQFGFTQADTMNVAGSYAGIWKKNDPEITPQWIVSKVGIYDKIIMKTKAMTVDTVGYLSSPVLGPAKEWDKVMWRGRSLESPSKDHVGVEVIGINNNGTEVPLFTLNETQQNFDISGLDAETYPYMKLRMRNADSVNVNSPWQLRYWNVMYTAVPEGSLSPNLGYTTKDTVEIGEIVNIAMPFKNLTTTKFEDSLLVKVSVIDRNNVTKVVPVPKAKDLSGGDTAMVRLQLDTKEFPGNNTLVLDINPDNAQPEQYHFNNVLFRDFYVKPDYTNPLLDVTFDGVRIINRDIVSSKPHIQIKLKDEAKYMLLNDTTIGSVQLKFPDGNTKDYYFDNDTLRFTPATSGANNTATIDFFPQLISQNMSEGDEYELAIKAKDKSGNRAGTLEYRVAFRVISKPMISNLLNYPNPFSTSTAFVFTLTGSEIPTNIKIQILTVTGKIVREITKDELGPLHIGRNITEFKWNGTDQYGQKLANGVYLYRVVTTMNGKKMEKYKSEADNTDKYFNNGYGKMYLMR